VSTKSIKIGTSCWIAVVKGFDKIERLNEEPKDRVNGKQKAPPRVDHLDVVGRLTPSMKWKPRIHNASLTCEPGGSASSETCARCRCNLN
jgi:hypothetical protein